MMPSLWKSLGYTADKKIPETERKRGNGQDRKGLPTTPPTRKLPHKSEKIRGEGGGTRAKGERGGTIERKGKNFRKRNRQSEARKKRCGGEKREQVKGPSQIKRKWRCKKYEKKKKKQKVRGGTAKKL